MNQNFVPHAKKKTGWKKGLSGKKDPMEKQFSAPDVRP